MESSIPRPPKSALLSKLEAFLPVLAQENAKLKELNVDSYNIETIENEEESNSSEDEEEKAPIIEMNFALGLLDEEKEEEEDKEIIFLSSDDDKQENLNKKIKITMETSKGCPKIEEIN